MRRNAAKPWEKGQRPAGSGTIICLDHCNGFDSGTAAAHDRRETDEFRTHDQRPIKGFEVFQVEIGLKSPGIDNTERTIPPHKTSRARRLPGACRYKYPVC